MLYSKAQCKLLGKLGIERSRPNTRTSAVRPEAPTWPLVAGSTASSRSEVTGLATTGPQPVCSASWSVPEEWNERKAPHTASQTLAPPGIPSPTTLLAQPGPGSRYTAAQSQMPNIFFPVFKHRLISHWTCPANSSPRHPDPEAHLCKSGARPGSGQPGPWKACAKAMTVKTPLGHDTRTPQATERAAAQKGVGHNRETEREECPNAH